MLFEELSGKEVVIIDDTDREIKSLQEGLEQRAIKTDYLKVDLSGDMRNHGQISTVKLVFLDLYYGLTFDAGFCANLIAEVVPHGRQYYLVAWTQDPDKTDIVMEELREIDLAPIAYTSKLKEKYRKGDAVYDIDTLLAELDLEFEQIKEVKEFPGQIIDIEENHILIKCMVDEKGSVFQIRRFDKAPLESVVDMNKGNYVMIRSVTKPGSRLFEFYNGSSELSKYFAKEDFFKTIEKEKLFDEE